MQSQPVVLIVGQGEPMEGALTAALEERGLEIARCATPDVHTHVEQIAPDMLVLIGDAAVRNGAALLRTLTLDTDASVLPVVLVSSEATLAPEASGFRSGPVAVLSRGLGAEAVAQRIAELAVEVPERPGLSEGDLDEEGLQKLVEIVSKELKAGILSVGSEASGSDTVSVVLDTERPPATNIEEALSQLRAMLPPTEQLHYEFYEAAGGRVSLLSAEQESSTTDLEYLDGVRIVLMDGDSSRNRVLLQALTSNGAQAVIAEPDVASLSGLRDIDPQVAIFGAASIQGEGFDVVRKMRQDPQLQWASLLVVRWAEIWPDNAYAPDLMKLANRIAALTKQDAALQRRAEEEARFDTRLESLGPGRMLRALAAIPGSRHITIAGRTTTVEVDVADGVVLGAYTSSERAPEQGIVALTALWKIPAGRATIWEQDVPSIANVLMPVDEALGLAARGLDEAPDPVTGVQRAVTEDATLSATSPQRPPQERSTAASSAPEREDDLEPSRSEHAPHREFEEELPTTQYVDPTSMGQIPEADYEPAAATARALPELYPPIDHTAHAAGPRFQSSVRARVTEDTEVPTAKVKRLDAPVAPDPALAAPRPAKVTVSEDTRESRPTLWFLLLLLTGAVALFVQWVGSNEAIEASAALSQAHIAPQTAEPTGPLDAPRERATSDLPTDEVKTTGDTETSVDPEIAAGLSNLPSSPQKASDVLVWRATPLIRQGRLTTAEALLERAWQLDDKNPQAMAAFAELHIARQKPSQAVVWAQIAVQKRPRRARYHVIYGDALALSGDDAAAKKAWRRALRLDKRNRAARERLARSK